MVQSTRTERLQSPKGEIYNQYDKNLGTATTASFVTALTVDCTPIRESVVVIHNNAAGDLDWQILGNSDHIDDIVAPTGTNDDDKGWVIIQSGSKATTVAPEVITFSNPWTQIIIQIKHTTLTTDVDVWHRGEN
ncbi:hypothetical protein LCGC14_1787750 [marine sediment metagenome]|uniref:Uncharacterized protein n=1 Tax=marine sediment metagenome TaxID=412755 RepID=A0A0F9GTF2_9ZZZZ